MNFKRDLAVLTLLMLGCAFTGDAAAVSKRSKSHAARSSSFHPVIKDFVPAGAHSKRGHTAASAAQLAEFHPVVKKFVPAKHVKVHATYHSHAIKTSRLAALHSGSRKYAHGGVKRVKSHVVAEDREIDAVKSARVQAADSRKFAESTNVATVDLSSKAVPTSNAPLIAAEKSAIELAVVTGRAHPQVSPQKAAEVKADLAAKSQKINELAAAKSEADKPDVVKIVTADLSKNEFYIFGENDKIPEKLIATPDTQMVVLGGDSAAADKKMYEFKLAAIKAAREIAVKDLAARDITAKEFAAIESQERDAIAQLEAAQNAVNEVKKIKEWHQSKDKKLLIGSEEKTPVYKDTTLLPEDKNQIQLPGQLAEKEKSIMPGNDLVLSAMDVDVDEAGLRMASVDPAARVNAFMSHKMAMNEKAAVKTQKVAVRKEKNTNSRAKAAEINKYVEKSKKSTGPEIQVVEDKKTVTLDKTYVTPIIIGNDIKSLPKDTSAKNTVTAPKKNIVIRHKIAKKKILVRRKNVAAEKEKAALTISKNAEAERVVEKKPTQPVKVSIENPPRELKAPATVKRTSAISTDVTTIAIPIPAEEVVTATTTTTTPKATAAIVATPAIKQRTWRDKMAESGEANQTQSKLSKSPIDVMTSSSNPARS